MKRKPGATKLKYLLIAGALTSIVALVVASTYASLHSSADKESKVPDNIDGVPLASGAYNLKHMAIGNAAGKELDYEVSSSREQVIDFYKRELPPWGSGQMEENHNIPGEVTLYYFWEDKDDSLPYTLEISLTIGDAVYHPSGSVLPDTLVSIRLYRLPILDKTPIYPGAEAVQTSQVSIPTGGDRHIDETLITFTTKATQKEVEDYYKEIMQQNGWTLSNYEAFDDATNAYVKGSILFLWSRGGPETGITGASVTLMATEKPGEGTSVELHLTGASRYVP